MKALSQVSVEELVPTILSIGYEKLDTATFLKTLSTHRINAVVDVRESAFSRRLDFRKNRLKDLLQSEGIAYFHLPKAGNPHRKVVKNDIEKCLRLYRDHISQSPKLVNEIAGDFRAICNEFPRIAVLCFERSADACHRSLLIDALKAIEFTCTTVEV